MNVKSLVLAAGLCSALFASSIASAQAKCPKADEMTAELNKLQGELKNPKLPPPEKMKMETHVAELKKGIEGARAACDKEMAMAKAKEMEAAKEAQMKKEKCMKDMEMIKSAMQKADADLKGAMAKKDVAGQKNIESAIQKMKMDMEKAQAACK